MRSLKTLEVESLFGRIDINAMFPHEITTIFGKNGSAKTTLLHIVANLLTGDIPRFAYLDFRRICLTLSDNTVIEVVSSLDTQESSRQIEVTLNGQLVVHGFDAQRVIRELRNSENDDEDEPSELLGRIKSESEQLPRISVTYFPAFRTTLEAAHGSPEEWIAIRNARSHLPIRSRRSRLYGDRSQYVTALARSLFGPFVPQIDYPSTTIIADELSQKMQEASFNLGRKDSQMLADSFGSVFDIMRDGSSSATRDPNEVLAEIKDILVKLDPESTDRFSPRTHTVYNRLRASVEKYDQTAQINEHLTPIMEVYRQSLQERLDAEISQFREIETYVQAVNRFLEDKQLTFENHRSPFPHPVLRMSEGHSAELLALSSGERQIVSLLFATIFEPHSKDSIVLIDEPEISLHIDWQQLLVQQIASYLNGCQLVICTHSPEVVSAFQNTPVEIMPSPAQNPFTIQHQHIENDVLF